MSEQALKLAELLCARLCHDLAGPIGAVATGAELLSDEDELNGDMANEALALLSSSAATAGARLKFLRTALGNASGALSAAALRDLVEGFIAGVDGVVLDWRAGEDGRWEGERVKLLLNLVLLARDCLPRGGEIAIHGGIEGVLEVRANGKNAAPGESAEALKAVSSLELGPRGAQGYYAAMLAADKGYLIAVSAVTETVAFRVG